MALQIVIETEDIVKREKGGTLTLSLKIFAEGADPKVDDPLFEETASADIKGHVDGQTTEQLVARAVTKAGKKLEEEALAYQRIQEYQEMVDTDAVKSDIEKALAR